LIDETLEMSYRACRERMPLWSPSAERVRVAVADELAKVDDSHTSGTLGAR